MSAGTLAGVALLMSAVLAGCGGGGGGSDDGGVQPPTSSAPSPSPPPPPPPPSSAAPTIGGCEVFPETAVFNTRIDDVQRFPAHASSAAWIQRIGTSVSDRGVGSFEPAHETRHVAGDVRHALRVTLRDSVMARACTWPARHRAGGDTTNGIPFGAVLRLNANFVPPANWTAQAKALAKAMQRYGLYVVDIASDLFVQGEPSPQWSDNTFSDLAQMRAADFEFVDLGAITRDAHFDTDSFQTVWP